MSLVGHEPVPGQRAQELRDVAELAAAGRVQVLLPVRGELPRVVVPIELTGCTAQCRPVLLSAKNGRIALGERRAVLLELIARLDHEDGERLRSVVLLEDLGVGRTVGIRRVELNQGTPACVVERGTRVVVQLHGLDVRGVGGADPTRDGEHERIIVGVFPRLEIVSVEPDDVRKVPIVTAEEGAVRACFCNAVLSQHVQPASGLDRVEQDHHSRVLRESDQGVRVGEVRRVRRRDVAFCQERRDPATGASVARTAGVRRAEQVHPECIESGCFSVGDVGLGVARVEIADQCLR